MARNDVTRNLFKFNQFTVLIGFVIAVLFMLAFGGIYIYFGAKKVAESVPSADVVANNVARPQEEALQGPPPSAEEYQIEIKSVAGPFFASVAQMQQADVLDAPAELSSLVGETQERLFTERVPSEFRETHLSLVLLLDQWKRALAGNAIDQQTALAKTDEFLAANAWLQP